MASINVDEFDPEEDVLRVERKGSGGGNLRTVFVNILDAALKKKKHELKNHSDPEISNANIMN